MAFYKPHNEIVPQGTDMKAPKQSIFIHILMVMTLFLGLHNPQINAALHIETSSISAENTPNHPSLKANNGAKFASRTQKTFKVKGSSQDEDTVHASYDIGDPSITRQTLLRSKSLYIPHTHIISARLLEGQTNVRAPPPIS